MRILMIALAFLTSALGTAQAQISLTQIQNLVADQDARSGSLLPFPAWGAYGQVTQGEEGFSVTYDGLSVLGLKFDSLVLDVRPLNDDILEVRVASYALRDSQWVTIDTVETQPLFLGWWNMTNQVYDRFSVRTAMTFAPLSEEEGLSARGIAELWLERGQDASVGIRVEDFELTGSRASDPKISVGEMTIALENRGNASFDPDGLVNEISDLFLDSENRFFPGAPAFSLRTLFFTEAELKVSLRDLTYGQDTWSGDLAYADLILTKSGEDPFGRQDLALRVSTGGGNVSSPARDDGWTYEFEDAFVSVEIGLSDGLSAIGKVTQLYRAGSDLYSLRDAQIFIDQVAQVAHSLAPRLEIRAKIWGYLASAIDKRIPEDDALKSKRKLEEGQFAFVFDLRDEISLNARISGLEDSSYQYPWYKYLASLNEGEVTLNYKLSPTFILDASSLISEVGGSLDVLGVADAYLPLDSLWLMPLAYLAAGDFQISAQGLYSGWQSDWGGGFYLKADEVFYTVGNTPIETGNRWNFDGGLNQLVIAQNNRDMETATFLTPDRLQALAEQGGEDLRVSIGSVTHDTNIDTQPFAPYAAKMLALFKQGVLFDFYSSYADIQPLIREAAIATLDQFDGLHLRTQIHDMLIPEYVNVDRWNSYPGFSLNKMDALFSWQRGQDRILDVEIRDTTYIDGQSYGLNEINLGYLSLAGMNSSPPEGFGEDWVDVQLMGLDFFLNTILWEGQGDAPPNFSWADYLETLIYDSAAEMTFTLMDFDLEALGRALAVNLGEFKIRLASTVAQTPLSLGYDIAMSWSALEAQTAVKAAGAYLNALFPQFGDFQVSVNASVSDGAMAALDQMPFMPPPDSDYDPQDMAAFFAGIDFEALMTMTMGSTTWGVEGTGAFTPDLTVDLAQGKSLRLGPFHALEMSPNFQMDFRLSGLERLKAAQQALSKAKDLGAFEFLRDVSVSTDGLIAYLDQRRARGDATDATDILTLQFTLPAWDDLRLNGLAFP